MIQKRIFLTLLLVIFSLFNALSVTAKPLNQVRWRAKPGTVALTFDDGPNPKYTPQILHILKEYHVPATFFVMGWAARDYPKLIHQMIREGHAVASHTMTHLKLPHLSQKKLAYEIIVPRDIIKKVSGKPPVCVRPPFGMGNKRVGAYIRSQGMVMVPMGFNSFDYNRPGVQKLTNWVVKNARSGRVFLLHDGPKRREQTVAALPAIIKGIRAKGLGFSAICYQ